MRKILRAVALTMALSILGVSSVFAAETPAEIQQDYANGRQYLKEINLGGVAWGKEVRRQSQDGFEKGYAELRRAHNIHQDCGIEQAARDGYEKGQLYLDWIREQTKAAAADRDRQGQEGYEKGIEYLKQCGWKF